MTRATWLTVSLGILAVPALVHAQGPFTVKIKDPQIGDVRTLEVRETSQTTQKIFAADNKVLFEKSETTVQHCACQEQVMGREEGRRRPTHVRRQYSKVSLQIDNKDVPLPYQGKQVEIQKVKGAYTFTMDGKTALTGEAARLLLKEFGKEDNVDLQRAVLPSKPVQVNDSWYADMATIVKDWQNSTGMQVDAAKAQGVGKLNKVYQKDGRTFGEMFFQLELPLTGMGKDKDVLPLSAGSRLRMDVTLDVCIDGHSTTGTLKAQYDVSTIAEIPLQDGTKGKMVIQALGSLEDACVEQVKR